MAPMTPFAELFGNTIAIDEAVEKYRALLEKHSREFNSDAVKTVLGQSELADEQFTVFRRRVEVVSNLIVRKVKVNRSRAPQESLNATGRVQYLESECVDAVLKGEGGEVEVVFFKPLPWECINPNSMSKRGITNALERRNLKHDPIAVIAVNEADHAFADNYPHETLWSNDQGNWCNYARFGCWHDERYVTIYRDLGIDLDDRWLVGVRPCSKV
jgi:hypothetical protein